MTSNTASRILRASSSPFAITSPPRQCLRTTPLCRPATSCPFSTTSSVQRDNNRTRGLSAIRAKSRPGKFRLITPRKLPKPVLNREELTTPTKNHGLMGFFNQQGTLLSTPEEDAAHGRGWTVEELTLKTWEEMHYLWWQCMKEKNRLATENVERQRLEPGYGQYEADMRLKAIQTTMRSIKEALLERSYAQTDAAELAKVDPDIDYNPTHNSFLYLGEAHDADPLSYGAPYEEDAEFEGKSDMDRQNLPSDAEPIAGTSKEGATKPWSDIDASTTGKPSSREDKRI